MNLVWDGVFDPFGNPSSITGSATMNLRFPGQYFDAETGLAQNWNRDYDPTIGRYVEYDPFGLSADINPYLYVHGNPLSGQDRDGGGLIGCGLGGVLGALVGGAGGSVEPGGGTVVGGTIGAEEGCELGSGIETAVSIAQASQPKNKCDCGKLYNDINDAVNDLKRRANQLKETPLNLPTTGKFSVQTHQYQFQLRQAHLRGLLLQANSKGCLSYRPDAWYHATRPTPWPL
jgi:RHS repeat-associated protein